MNVVLLNSTDHDTTINILYAACRQCYYSGFVGDKYPFSDIPMEKKAALIKDVINSGHHSIAEHCSFTFAIQNLSRGAAQQLTRHRIACYSVQSTRYNNMENVGYFESDVYQKNEEAKRIYEDSVNSAAGCYQKLISLGIPKEDARDILPLSLNSNLIMTMNCRELIHFIGVRTCKRAQKEIRDLANKILKICQEHLPEVFENIGPKCKQLGYCNEGSRSCHMMPLKEEVFKVYYESTQKE